MSRTQRIGLLVGPAACLAMLLLPAPAELPPAGWRTAAVAVLMAVWWITEAIPIPATALLPLVLFPLFDVLPMGPTAARYGHDLVFLQMGGFMLAVALERHGLHRRIALGVVARVGTKPHRVVLGFMIASAFLSMWISNTATTAMMLPIAMAVGALFRNQDHEGPYAFGIALVLGIAYAATIGGVSTLIGTPPNVVLAAQARELLDIEIGFLEWMVVGLPLAIVMLPIGWILLTRWLYPAGDLRGDAAALIDSQRRELGRMSRGEITVGVVFAVTALSWVMRAPKDLGFVSLPGITTFAPMVHDSTIAIAATVALFVLPTDWRRGEFALDWPSARKIPWGVLVLFGGGLALAHGMSETGLATWIGNGVAGLDVPHEWMIYAVVAALFVFLTEVTSNVATTTMAMPIMAGAAIGLGVEPLLLMATAALSSSMAFMLPVATPPNAIVFGSGYLTIPQMVRAGFFLNLIAICLVTAAAMLLVPLLLG